MKNILTITLLFLFSSFALSEPCKDFKGEELINCLKGQINTHKPEPLSYLDFNNLLASHRISHEQADELINYAYSENILNPILFRQAREKVAPEVYSLNFLWIHKDKLTEKGHLIGRDDEKLNARVLFPLIDWSSKQPEANINFWYDGYMVDHENVENTKKLISINLQLKGKKIRFMNIRDIPFVKTNSDLFSPKIPIFFRVDLAKAVIADFVMRVEGLSFVVNIDNDIAAITRAQLFDEPTLYALKNIGYSFGSTPGAEEENSFIILHSANDLNTINIHYNAIIEKAKKIAEENPFLSQQDVFSFYKTFKSLMRIQFRDRNQGQTWASKNIQVVGKPMIIPKSQFGILGGYEEEIIRLLKNALARVPSTCPHCGY